jgi:hypothetical protein
LFTATAVGNGTVEAIVDALCGTALITVAAIPMLDAPTLSFENITGIAAKVVWNSVANATSYLVSYGTDEAAGNAGSLTASGTNCTLSGLRQNTKYYVKVKGVGIYEGREGTGDFTTLACRNNVTISSVEVGGIRVNSGSTVTSRDAVIACIVAVEAGRTISSISLGCADQGYLIKSDVASNECSFLGYVNLMRGGNTILINNVDSAGEIYQSDPIVLDAATLSQYDIKVQLTWNGTNDADLSLIAPNGNNKCYYGDRNPDWGVAGDTSDNPILDRDIRNGYGPEWISVQSPVDGTYTVKARMFSGNYPVTFTVKIFIKDVLAQTFTHTFNDAVAGTFWTPCTITKSGTSLSVAEVGTVSSSGVAGLSVPKRK